MKKMCEHSVDQQHTDLRIHINGQHVFFLSKDVISSYSGKVRNSLQKNGEIDQELQFNDFPGGPYGFELASKFCYSKGRTCISPSNVSLLHCAAVYLDMSEDVSNCNLFQRTDTFLQGLFYWTWIDILTALKNSEPFVTHAHSSGLLDKLAYALLSKICANSDLISSSSSSSTSSCPSSPEIVQGFKSKPSFCKAWWFDDLTSLSPYTIKHIMSLMIHYGIDRMIVTKFLIHYLKQKHGTVSYKPQYSMIGDAVVDNVVMMDKSMLSCRWLLRVLRVVSCFGLGEDGRSKFEGVIGGLLDQAALDDLLACLPNKGDCNGMIYDVGMVERLVRFFLNQCGGGAGGSDRLRRVGKLMDKYLMEIAPDPKLKVGKFLAVAESLPHSARDCFDGVYRAVDMYLEAHPGLTIKDQVRLCRAISFGKLSLTTCKDIAKNPRFPPTIAMEALSSQQSKGLLPQDHQTRSALMEVSRNTSPATGNCKQMGTTSCGSSLSRTGSSKGETEEEDHVFKNKMERMQWRVVELEKACKEMQSQMSRLMRTKIDSSGNSPIHNQYLPKLCS